MLTLGCQCACLPFTTLRSKYLENDCRCEKAERTRMLDPAHLALLLLPLLHTPLCLLPRHALNWQRDNEIKIQDNPPAR